ncbi:MAG: choice-of-anchor D domain-containing protein, partial [Deltaproteobacteria bacterium]|nr:choice-of-anchor D domain-containing protein [Deltaproteobacteria bacterium]
MRRFSYSIAALVLATVASVSGCSCERQVTVKKLGALEVVYPDPANEKVEISSAATENKATYDLGPVFMGQTREAAIQVRNTGQGTLTLKSLEVLEGTEFVTVGTAVAPTPAFDIAFTVDTEVEAAGGADISVKFTPITEAKEQVDYTVRLKLQATGTEDGKDLVEITLLGRGVSGVCDLGSLIDFGAVARGDTGLQEVIIRNPTQLEATATVGEVFGSDAQAFTYATDSARGSVTVPPGGEKKVKLQFTPTEIRAYLAFVKMRASAACPEISITVQGEGVDTVLSWYWLKPDGTKANTVDFGYASPGSEVAREVKFENLGVAPVTVSQLAYNKNEFKVVGAAGAADPTVLTVPSKGTATLPVTFKPALLGPRTAALSFNTTLLKQPTGTMNAKGFGGGPDIDVKPAPTLAFGKVAYFAGITPPSFTKRRLTVQNVGTLPSPPDVAGNLQLQPTLTLAPGAGVTDTSEITAVLAGYNATTGLEAKAGANTAFVDVTLTPASLGQKSWTLKVASNDPDEPEVTIEVTADIQQLPPCSYTVTPATLDYGLVTPPNFKDLSITIKNTGNDECLLNNLGLSAASSNIFSLPQGPIDSATLAAGQSLNVIVRAWPQGAASTTLNVVTGAVEFFMSSPTQPQKSVALKATVAQGCLTIAPSDLDFGTVAVGCSSSTRTFNIYNTCSTAVTVNSVQMVSAAGYPAGTALCPGGVACPEFKFVQAAATGSIPAGSPTPMTFSAKYSPLDTGPDQGAIAVNATQNGQAVTYVVTLQGTGDTEGLNTDTFTQDSKPKADILLVIDNSCSMASYQQSLATNFQSFIQYANAAGVDYNIAVTTTDDDSGGFGGSGEQGRFVSGTAHTEKVLTPNTASVETKFGAKVNVGTNGSAEETCLSPALKALTAPLINADNAGFLRTDAKLAVVCVTDAPDQSAQTAVFYYNAFLNIKGFKNANAFTFNAIAGFNPTPAASCSGYDSGPDDGKYAYLVGQTNGVK